MTSATLKEDLSEIQKTFVEGKMLSLKLKERDLPGTDQLEQVFEFIILKFLLIVSHFLPKR